MEQDTKNVETITIAEQDKKYVEEITIEITPENQAWMLGARTSGMLGDKAYDRVIRLDVNSLRVLARFATIVADLKEQEEVHN
tara:strand:- start:189 stop:437 length:249 start_codon:yes stop_codon:yes gene_type:complete